MRMIHGYVWDVVVSVCVKYQACKSCFEVILIARRFFFAFVEKCDLRKIWKGSNSGFVKQSNIHENILKNMKTNVNTIFKP